MAELTPLEQVQLDARRITIERIEAEAKAKVWQEAQERPISLDESVEAAQAGEEPEVQPKPKAVKTKKGKK